MKTTIASAIILGLFTALAVIYMTGCTTALKARFVSDGKAFIGKLEDRARRWQSQS